MSDSWAKELADKISAGKAADAKLDPRSAQIIKVTERLRARAPELLFNLFTEKIKEVNRHIAEAEGRGGFFQRLFHSPTQVLNYEITPEQTFRFQLREAYGTRLELHFDRGALPAVRIDLATAELIQGEYLPIFRDNGAIAGAQVWSLKRSENKHPELIYRLFLIFSVTALDEGLKDDELVSWRFEEDHQAFTTRNAEQLIESLINNA